MATSRRVRRWAGVLAAAIALTWLAGSAAPAAASSAAASARETTAGVPRIRLPIPRVRIRLPPPPVTVLQPAWRTSVERLTVALTVPEAAGVLADLYRRRGYQRLMVEAFCTGITTLAEDPPAPEAYASGAEWRRFLLGYLDRYWRAHLRSYSQPYALNVIDTWLGAGDVASISNWQAARLYLRACGH